MSMEMRYTALVILTLSLGATFGPCDAWQSNQRLPTARRWRHMSLTTRSSAVVPPETSPLAPHTFAGMVERGLLEKFKTTTISRVLESWRLSEIGYEHREFVGSKQDPPILDADNSNCHQYSHSYVPGLRVKSFWNVQDFPWTKKLQSRYEDIKQEFVTVTADMDKLTQEGNNIWAGALTDDAASYGTGWKTLVLMNRGRWDPVNVGLFPQAAAAVRDSGCPAVEVFFASMAPKSDVKLHSDFTNFLLTSHLAVDIPENGQNKCRLTIGDNTRQWINGEVMLFDTTIMHSAVNESDKTRYILMLRLWHPDLTKPEREALQYIYDCLDFPELTQAETPKDRQLLERQVEATRSFPSMDGKAGFGASSSNATKKKKKN